MCGFIMFNDVLSTIGHDDEEFVCLFNWYKFGSTLVLLKIWSTLVFIEKWEYACFLSQE